MTAALAGRLEADPRLGEGYIEAVGGQVYELGAPPPESTAETKPSATTKDEAGALGKFKQEGGYVAAAVAIAGAVGFTMANVLAPPPPPPPPPTRIFITRPSKPMPQSAAVQKAAPAPSLPAAPLTAAEVRERAELRLERDKTKIRMLELKVQEDEQMLGEARRIETERGPAGTPTTNLIFPPPVGP